MITVEDMLAFDEGFKDIAYEDTRGKRTVGIGFNMDDLSAKLTWSKAQISEDFTFVYNKATKLSKDSAEKLLDACLTTCIKYANALFHDFNTYPEGVQLALLNLIYNLGGPNFSDFTTFINRIRMLNFTGAIQDLETTLWAKQVPQRCLRVCGLLNGDDSGYY